MNYIIYVRLARFYVATLERMDPNLREKPLAIAHEKAILDLNEAAWKLGIRRGMRQNEAKTILKGTGNCIAFEEEPFREARRRWLDRLAEFTEIIDPRLPHEAFADFSGHPDVASIAWEMKERLNALTKLPVVAGLGRSSWMAQLASDQKLPEQRSAWEIAFTEAWNDPKSYLSGRSVNMLAPVEPDDRRRLRFLGYRTIGEVAALPRSLLVPQFQERTGTLLEAVRGGPYSTIQARYPEDRALAIERIAGGIDTEDQLDHMIEKVAEKLARQLAMRDSFGTELELVLEMESGMKLRRKRSFSKPIDSQRAAFIAIRLSLPKLNESLVEIKADLPRLERVVRKQRRLDGTAEHTERTLSAEMAFLSLKKAYGDDAIHVAAELPVPRRAQVLRIWSDAIGWH